DERHWVIDRIARGRESGTLTDVDQAVLDSLPTLKARRQLRKAAKRSGGKRAAKAVAAQQAQALDLIQATG
ncbi:MAG TPA: PrsW family intramembrane metalloprotease, partial [Mycobacterium sp.]|nr:PrsW family intramembrane metalloprotease [Mycobacterium sp.]